MKSSLQTHLIVFFLSLLQTALPLTCLATEKGTVDYSLQWGSSEQLYTYVFSGTVICQGHPCADAEIQVDVENSSHPSKSEITRTSADGHYLIQLSLAGNADDAAQWKLLARASGTAPGEPVELEGRSILMQDETTVVLEHPIEIVQS